MNRAKNWRPRCVQDSNEPTMANELIVNDFNAATLNRICKTLEHLSLVPGGPPRAEVVHTWAREVTPIALVQSAFSDGCVSALQEDGRNVCVATYDFGAQTMAGRVSTTIAATQAGKIGHRDMMTVLGREGTVVTLDPNAGSNPRVAQLTACHAVCIVQAPEHEITIAYIVPDKIYDSSPPGLVVIGADGRRKLPDVQPAPGAMKKPKAVHAMAAYGPAGSEGVWVTLCSPMEVWMLYLSRAQGYAVTRAVRCDMPPRLVADDRVRVPPIQRVGMFVAVDESGREGQVGAYACCDGGVTTWTVPPYEVQDDDDGADETATLVSDVKGDKNSWIKTQVTSRTQPWAGVRLTRGAALSSDAVVSEVMFEE